MAFANDMFSLHALFPRVNRKHLCAALANERQEPGGRVAGVVDSIPEPLGELNVVRFARKARFYPAEEKCIAALLEEGQARFLHQDLLGARPRA